MENNSFKRHRFAVLLVAVLLLGVLIGMVFGGTAQGTAKTGDRSGETVISPSPTSPAASDVPPEASSASSSPSKTATSVDSAPAQGKPITVTFECTVNGKSTYFNSMQEIWAIPELEGNCSDSEISAGDPSEIEERALKTAYGSEYRVDNLSFLYWRCAQTGVDKLDGASSKAQVHELEGSYVLCPDHPKATVIESNIAKGYELAAEAKAQESAIAEGRQVGPGSYLVGVDIEPGTWQSVGEKVTDCYWEISDDQGNILQNNFVNVAPPFSVYIPAEAAGFTVQGCAFRLQN